MCSVKRLYFITGKGGVGKTTIASSLAINLAEHSNVIYVATDDPGKEIKNLLKSSGAELSILSLMDSTREYLARKIKSEVIASWVLKAPIFKTIFDMVPGFGLLILLGHVTELAINNPDKVIIFDAPSSGHMITMFESLANFKKILGQGILVKDIDTISNFITSNDNSQIFVVTLPTMMAINEGIELKDALERLNNFQVEIILNNSMNCAEIDQSAPLPDFLKTKLDLETDILNQHSESLSKKLAYIPELNQVTIIGQLMPLTTQLV